MFFKPSLILIAFTSVIILITSCTSIGPREIYVNRNRYNDVIQDTNNEQLLKNIVRIRYIEPTSFLKLSNVTASYTLSPSISTLGSGLTYGTTSSGGSSILPSSSVLTRALNINPNINYSDTPTITYLPVEDSEFVNELMTPITLESVHMLSYGGIYDRRLINRLIMQSVGYLDNASAASSAKMFSLPVYKKYYDYLEVLIRLQDGIEFMPSKVNDKYAIAVHFLPGYENTSAANQLRDIFHIPHTGQDILLGEYSTTNMPVNYVLVKTRSIYGIMTYLSYGVDIPASDQQYIYHHYEANGCPFDWSTLLNGIIAIRTCDMEPQNVFVKTFVHGHWFYISNTDTDSKATFVLLTRLITLTAGKQLGGGSQGPVLTLPAR